VLYELPDLGDALLQTVGLVHLRLEIHLSCLHRSVNDLSDADATSNISTRESGDVERRAAAARFYRLLALFDMPAKEAAETEGELHRLWLRIANLLSSGTSTLDRTSVLSCLLAQKSQSMCRWFLKLLNTADLDCMISRNTPMEIHSAYSLSATAGSSFVIEQTLSVDSTGKAGSEEKVIDDTGSVSSPLDKTGVVDSLPPSVNDDIVRIIALSSTASHHVAWHQLYLMCFERRLHFLDLFLVRNMYLHLTCVCCILCSSIVSQCMRISLFCFCLMSS